VLDAVVSAINIGHSKLDVRLARNALKPDPDKCNNWIDDSMIMVPKAYAEQAGV
jgi:hypothetical protein